VALVDMGEDVAEEAVDLLYRRFKVNWKDITVFCWKDQFIINALLREGHDAVSILDSRAFVLLAPFVDPLILPAKFNGTNKYYKFMETNNKQSFLKIYTYLHG
jgi:hypothetical protein